MRSGMEYRMNAKKKKKRRKEEEEEEEDDDDDYNEDELQKDKQEQKEEDLLWNGTLIQRNKTGSYTTQTNEMHSFLH
jgi:hypothetical protein